MTLSEEIKKYQETSGKETKKALQWVLDLLSERGRAAGSQAKDKARGDSAYYTKLANKRWKK